MAWNPINKNHWLYDFCEVNPPKSFKYTHSTFRDNPFLSKEYIAELEELYIRNPAKARVFCDGLWGNNPEGVIFHNWRVEEFDHTTLGGELCCGLDFGFVNDPTAFICSIADDK